MKQFLYSIILVLSLSSAFGCTKEEKILFTVSEDLLKELPAYIQAATQRIDFRKDGNAEPHLLHGWSYQEDQAIWAKADRSSVAFHHYDTTNSLKLELHCMAIASRKQQAQITNVFVNDTLVDSFKVQPNKFKRFELVVPQTAVQTGQNILEFRFAYTTKPEELNPSSKDTRTLAVAFQEISFRGNDHVSYTAEDILEQKTNSAFNVFSALPERFELELQYQSVQDAKPSVEIIRENHEKITIELAPKNTDYRKTFHFKDVDISKLRFISSGPPGSLIMWNQIRIHKEAVAAEEPILNEGEEGFSKHTKPDILLYVVDTLRADHMGCYGYSRPTTPHIDRFAQENTLFRNAYTVASWTRASAANILSGLWPKNNKTSTLKDHLPEDIVTLAEILKENDYYTAAFVTNVNLSPDLNFAQGFTEHKSLFKKDSVTLTVMSDELNKHILEFLHGYTKKKDRKPLFLLVWAMDPHSPYAPPESVKHLFNIDQYTPIDTYDKKLLQDIAQEKIHLVGSQLDYIKTRYDQEIYFNDQHFGELLDHMKTLGMYDDSVIVFTSDHGEEFFEHGSVGHGRTLYNEQVKIPFIIKAEGLAKGERLERAQLIDIYPTILDILSISEPYKLDGISLLSKNSLERTLYFELNFGQNDVNAQLDGEKKLIFNKVANRPPSKEPVPIIELFDVEDSLEQKNLELESFEDYSRLQDLFLYKYGSNLVSLERKEKEISQELNQQLRDLGYVD